jgi:hypothetical protein
VDEADQIRAIRESAAYKASKAQLADREWRIDNLYWIKNKEGVPIPFKRNAAQRFYSANEWFRDTILKSRKLGFSTYIGIDMLDHCMFASNTQADIIDQTQDDAEDKLDIARFAYQRLPQRMREAVWLEKDNAGELSFSNGSGMAAGISSRGGTPQILHVSEYGPISASNPGKAKEIKTGSITSVPKSGKIRVESTAKGTSGQFFDLVKAGEQLQALGQPLTPLDFKLHFFGWYMDPDNRLPANMVSITHELREYFDELRVKHGIKLDAMQEAWYAKTREFLGPDDVKSEQPSTPDECFFASLEGAYWKDEMNRARREGRVGKPVPYDNSRPVHTYWDLGMDGNMAIGFFQTDGIRHRHIDFACGETAGLGDGLRILQEKAMTRGFRYGKHYGPHDLQTRDWSAMKDGQITAPTRKEVAAEHGVEFIVVPRVGDKADAIEAGRRFINASWFCSEYAGELVECLDNYSRLWNKTTSQWMAAPAKNGFDHGADALQQAAMGLQPDVVHRRDQVSRAGGRRGSHWSS